MSSKTPQKIKSFLIEDILGREDRPPGPAPFPPPVFCFGPQERTLYGLYCAAVAVGGERAPEPEVKARKSRRNRTVFTEGQLMGLEMRFDSQKYLSTPDRAELARALGLTQLQVKTWYQNRRMKWKKQVLQTGCPVPPTKPKGRPKKNSIPNFSQLF